MLKIGNDHFEATHLEPQVEVCNRRYVFDAKGPCPAFVVNPKVARAALQKQRADDVEYAQLVEANVSVAPSYSGLDGGMNEVFHTQFPGEIISLARVLPPGSGIELPQLPPIPWTDNHGSVANRVFGALFGGVESARTAPLASPTTTLAVPD